MSYARTLEGKIFPEYIDSDEIVVITGMRRVGKTTLCKSIFEKIESKNKIFLDIENPIDQKLFEEDDYSNIITNFVKKFDINPTERIYIFLDEIQSSPNIVKAIKYLYDHLSIKFILTGSSSFYLKNLFSESLAGRKILFELYPLNFEEFLIFKGEKKEFFEEFNEKEVKKSKIIYEKYKYLYDEFVEYGGFPGVVVANDNKLKIERLEDIFKSYFEKEVRGLSEFRDINAFRDLMLILLQRSGSKIDIQKLASEVKITRETVYKYLSFLESTYFIHLITPYSQNIDREISGTKKIYICDTGIANNFAKLDAGNLFENAIYLALKKYSRKICYYEKRRTEGEIDFIFPDEAIAFEVKTKAVSQDYLKLKKLSSAIGMPKQYVISKEFSEEIGTIPAIEI